MNQKKGVTGRKENSVLFMREGSPGALRSQEYCPEEPSGTYRDSLTIHQPVLPPLVHLILLPVQSTKPSLSNTHASLQELHKAALQKMLLKQTWCSSDGS